MTDQELVVVYERLPRQFYPQLPKKDVPLLFDFFIVFSRFEYALKKSGYRKIKHDNVYPDWDSFRKAIKSRFDKNKSELLRKAFKYYLNIPPNIQTFRDDNLAWRSNEQREDETEVLWVIRSVGIVRNNLFHGGKFPWDPRRDPNLLFHGLVILYECLELDSELREAFFSSDF